MSEDPRNRLLAFNRELAALAATGLPIDLGVGRSSESNAELLQRVDTLLTSSAGDEQSIDRLLAADHSIPLPYRVAARTLLSCDDPTIAIDQVASPAAADQRLNAGLKQSLIYPLVIVALTYAAFILLCVFAVPTIAAVYQQLAKAPSASLSFLLASRDTLLLWSPLPPLLVAVVWWWAGTKKSFRKWIPSGENYLQSIRNAQTARRLAALTKSGISIDRAVELVGIDVASDSKSNIAADRMTDTTNLLSWAVHGDLDGESRPRVLSFVGQIYQQRAEHQSRRWRTVLPALLAVVIGGTFVLAYTLCLFLPIVQLLKDISLPGGA